MQQDFHRITSEDGQNLLQFGIASICQSESISYINQHSLDMLTQFIINDMVQTAQICQTITTNSGRSLTNTTDVALALQARGTDIAEVVHYISKPTEVRAGVQRSGHGDETGALGNNNNSPAPVPVPAELNSSQYPVYFSPDQTNSSDIQRVLGVGRDGSLISTANQSPHQDMPHVPPYFPTPPTNNPTLGQHPQEQILVTHHNDNKRARHQF